MTPVLFKDPLGWQLHCHPLLFRHPRFAVRQYNCRTNNGAMRTLNTDTTPLASFRSLPAAGRIRS
jgi:hypothetical protein